MELVFQKLFHCFSERRSIIKNLLLGLKEKRIDEENFHLFISVFCMDTIDIAFFLFQLMNN